MEFAPQRVAANKQLKIHCVAIGQCQINSPQVIAQLNVGSDNKPFLFSSVGTSDEAPVTHRLTALYSYRFSLLNRMKKKLNMTLPVDVNFRDAKGVDGR